MKKAHTKGLEIFWQMFRHFRNCVSNSQKVAKRDYYTGMILENKFKPKLMWKCLRELLPGNSKSTPKGLLVNGQIITEKKPMANAFNQYFTSICKNLANKITSVVTFTPPNPFNICFRFPTVTPEFVEKQLSSMPENKAVGLDRLPGKLLRAASPVISKPLAFILNISLQSGKFISEWKHAKVLPLHKSGPVMETNNYRPISILPILSKLLERFVHNHFTSFLEQHNLITMAQSGFRR
jgi:hypothetical protein